VQISVTESGKEHKDMEKKFPEVNKDDVKKVSKNEKITEESN